MPLRVIKNRIGRGIIKMAETLHVDLDSDGSGMLHGKYSSSRVYLPEAACLSKLRTYCDYFVRRAWQVVHDHDESVRYMAFCPLWRIVVKTNDGVQMSDMQPMQISRLNGLIKNAAVKYITEKAEKIYGEVDINDPSQCESVCAMPDWQFLIAISKTRDYQKQCAICLTDKIMGTTCTCGHTEIAVFVPCGHAICARPCFLDWAEHEGKSFDDKTFLDASTGVTYSMRGVKDIQKWDGMKCPTCRRDIHRVFRAEEVHVQDKNQELENITKQIGISSMLF